MTHLEDFVKAIEYRITGGSEYQWDSFGPDARYLDCNDDDGANGTYSISAIFDSQTQQVYSIEVWDYIRDKEYRWIDLAYVKNHMQSCSEHEVDVYESLDGRNYVELELAEDILEKANALVNGLEYDDRVQIPLDMDQETVYNLMQEAHKRDLTLNQFVEFLLTEEIERRKQHENYTGV